MEFSISNLLLDCQIYYKSKGCDLMIFFKLKDMNNEDLMNIKEEIKIKILEN